MRALALPSRQSVGWRPGGPRSPGSIRSLTGAGARSGGRRRCDQPGPCAIEQMAEDTVGLMEALAVDGKKAK